MDKYFIQVTMYGDRLQRLRNVGLELVDAEKYAHTFFDTYEEAKEFFDKITPAYLVENFGYKNGSPEQQRFSPSGASVQIFKQKGGTFGELQINRTDYFGSAFEAEAMNIADRCVTADKLAQAVTPPTTCAEAREVIFGPFREFCARIINRLSRFICRHEWVEVAKGHALPKHQFEQAPHNTLAIHSGFSLSICKCAYCGKIDINVVHKGDKTHG